MVVIGRGDVGAAYTLEAEQRAQGVPPHWMSYVSVASADDAAAKAVELGGTLVAGPFDVFEHGRMAVLQDPTGAFFSVWEPRKHIGVTRLNEPGALCWTELTTTDTAKAGAFYKELFGWQGDEMEMGPMKYTMFTNGGVPAGGMLQLTPDMGNVPPNWMPYFAVNDCDDSATRASALGGQVIVPPSDTPYGRFSVLLDPQGAAFSIIKQTE